MAESHDPMCPVSVYGIFDMAGRRCQCDLIAHVVEREKAKADLAILFWEQEVRNMALRHHYVDVQGGPVRRCCAVCRTHVPGHPFCVLVEGYDGPLPEGHRWEEPE